MATKKKPTIKVSKKKTKSAKGKAKKKEFFGLMDLPEELADRGREIWLAGLGAGLIEGAARLSRRRPVVCREMIRVMKAGAAYDGSRATRELGLEYTPLDAMIERTVSWFRAEGLLD